MTTEINTFESYWAGGTLEWLSQVSNICTFDRLYRSSLVKPRLLSALLTALPHVHHMYIDNFFSSVGVIGSLLPGTEVMGSLRCFNVERERAPIYKRATIVYI